MRSWRMQSSRSFETFPTRFCFLAVPRSSYFMRALGILRILIYLHEGPRYRRAMKSSNALRRELSPIAQVLQLGELQFGSRGSSTEEGSIFVSSSSGQRLFRVDLTKFGSAIESEIETHPIEAQSGESVEIKSATKELILLQKAEAFLLRRIVKARDAYDIHVLLQKGAVLSPNLSAHLEDAIHANEIDGALISERIALVNLDLCVFELKPILPPEIYAPLEKKRILRIAWHCQKAV